jgi:DNA-binding transcriptional LysR family regulator
MALDDIDWNLYRSFLHVLKAGSLSGAARSLGSSQPTVGRHIEALEAALGTTLFTRSTEGLVPTALAQHIAGSVHAMASLSGAIAREASAEAEATHGTVRIAASETVGVEVLPPMLAELRTLFPELALELALSNRNEDILRGAADIAVRMTRPEQLSLVARKVGAVEIGLFAHRSYLERAGMPASATDLVRHALIGFDADPVLIRAAQSLGLDLSRDAFVVRSDSEHAQFAALRAGIGIGACQRGIARREPDLLPVLPDRIGFTLDMWLVTHEDLRANRRVRQVYDVLYRRLAEYAQPQR